MWKSKKFILILTVAVLALVGGTAGVVMAADSNSTTTTTTTTSSPWDTFTSKVASILGLDEGTVQDAMNQARDEMREQALENRLDALVVNGQLTQEEADQYLEWWQARPDIQLPGLMADGFGGGMMGGGGHHWGPPPCAPDSSSDTGT